jgi:hypothetical protein
MTTKNAKGARKFWQLGHTVTSCTLVTGQAPLTQDKFQGGKPNGFCTFRWRGRRMNSWRVCAPVPHRKDERQNSSPKNPWMGCLSASRKEG